MSLRAKYDKAPLTLLSAKFTALMRRYWFLINLCAFHLSGVKAYCFCFCSISYSCLSLITLKLYCKKFLTYLVISIFALSLHKEIFSFSVIFLPWLHLCVPGTLLFSPYLNAGMLYCYLKWFCTIRVLNQYQECCIWLHRDVFCLAVFIGL